MLVTAVQVQSPREENLPGGVQQVHADTLPRYQCTTYLQQSSMAKW